ncbi:SWI/SNF complex subunit SWI3C [Glycine soja]
MPASPSENRTRWRKRKRDSQISRRHQKHEEDDDDDDENPNAEEDLAERDYDSEDQTHHNHPNSQPHVETEVLSDHGVQISQFPAVIKRSVNRPHSSVTAIVALERALESGENKAPSALAAPVLENVSHGQLQALSSVPSDSFAFDGDSSFVITPPPILEGRGVVKRYGTKALVVPMHSDWFSPATVHRLERQVVPHFFSGKSPDHTPEKYMECRNCIVALHMEDPGKRITVSDCKGLLAGVNVEDLTRIVRFLDHWGIINYCVRMPSHESPNAVSCLREETSGEVRVPSEALKSIDSLIKFDKPNCKLKADEIYSSLSAHSADVLDLEDRIREHLSENHCNYCSCPLPVVYYQSQKEVHWFFVSNLILYHGPMAVYCFHIMDNHGLDESQVWHFIPQNMEPVYCTTAKPSMLTNVSCTFAVSLILCTSKNFYSQAIHPIGLLPLKLGKWTFLSQDWHSLTKYTELPSYCASALCLFRCRFDISLRVVPSLLFLYLRLISCFFIHIFNSCQNISISSILFQISATYASNNHIPWPLIVFKTPPNSLMILPSIPLLPRTTIRKAENSPSKVDILLCTDCFHDGRFVIGHSSIDFVRVDSTRDYGELDGDSWTDQETLLLLEAMEIYNENWNEIAEHVGTKSKAQCILHFLRLPMEDGKLENINVPSMSLSSNAINRDHSGRLHCYSNGDTAGTVHQTRDSDNRLPFANSGNPVMALVAFLASAVGPRVAASCAHAALAVLSEDNSGSTSQMEAPGHDNRTNSENIHCRDGGPHGETAVSNNHNEDKAKVRGSWGLNEGRITPLSAEKVKDAAKAGLSAAAMKAKLFADHEEREIQRLCANIVNHQVSLLFFDINSS